MKESMCVCLGYYECVVQRVQFGLVESEHRVSPLLHHPDPLTLAMAFVKPVTCFPEQLVLFSARWLMMHTLRTSHVSQKHSVAALLYWLENTGVSVQKLVRNGCDGSPSSITVLINTSVSAFSRLADQWESSEKKKLHLYISSRKFPCKPPC